MRSLKMTFILTFATIGCLLASPSRAAAPTFQALDGFGGHLAILEPTRLLTASAIIKSDAGFNAISIYTGVASDPVSGKVFVTAIDYRDDHPNSYFGEVDFTTGIERTLGVITGEIIVNIAFDGTGHLFGLTDNRRGSHPHAILSIDKATAASSAVKVLDSHGGPADDEQSGAVAWNSADGFLYYADLGSDGRLFIDRLATGTFDQTPVLTAGPTIPPSSIAFAAGRIWIGGTFFYSADINDLAGGFKFEGFPSFPSPDGNESFNTTKIFPATSPCIPSATAACLYNRFRVEVTYDTGAQNGSGSGNVLLESPQSVKFSFFDAANVELVVKLLNACVPPYNKWWFFAGGLTNVGVSLKVTDTATGEVKSYSSQRGKLFQTIGDTKAFNCP